MDERNEDARLTAYALGELDGPEQAEWARRVAADRALRERVEEVREVAGLLESALGAEPAPALTDAGRETLLARARGVPAGSGDPGRRARVLRLDWRWKAVAAAGVLAVAAALLTGPGRRLLSPGGGGEQTAGPTKPLRPQPPAGGHDANGPGQDRIGPPPTLVPTPLPGRPAYVGTPEDIGPNESATTRPGAAPASRPGTGADPTR